MIKLGLGKRPLCIQSTLPSVKQVIFAGFPIGRISNCGSILSRTKKINFSWLSHLLVKKGGKIVPHDSVFVTTPLPKDTHARNRLNFTLPPNKQIAIALRFVLRVSNTSEATNVPLSAVTASPGLALDTLTG